MNVKSQGIALVAGIVTTAGTVGYFNAGVSALQKSSSTIQITQIQKGVRFTCNTGYDQESDKRLPTTYAWYQDRKYAVIRWKTNYFAQSNFPPQARCDKASSQFNIAYKRGVLEYLGVGEKNGQSVICAVKTRPQDWEVKNCSVTLMTLRPSDDAEQFVKDLVDVLNGRRTGPVQHSAGTETYYSPEAWKYHRIDFQNFLNTATPEPEPK